MMDRWDTAGCQILRKSVIEWYPEIDKSGEEFVREVEASSELLG